MSVVRQVIKMGKSSIAVIIPSDFANALDLKAGDSVIFEIPVGRSLTFRKIQESEKPKVTQ